MIQTVNELKKDQEELQEAISKKEKELNGIK